MRRNDPGPWGDDRPRNRVPLAAQFLGEQSMARPDGSPEQAIVRLFDWLGRRRAARRARRRAGG